MNFREGFIELSFLYAKFYQEDGKGFIRFFQKFPSVREICKTINEIYKPMIGEPNQKIIDYCKKFNLGEDLAKTLNIIYELLKK